MHNTSVFFEEYKRLDHLRGDLFGSRAGVTACLSQMERDTFEGRRIPNWDADYQMLKRFRHLRARLAHEECAFETLDISQRDIADIQAFHKRILSQNDPLALLEKKRHAHPRAENAPTAPVPTRSACAHRQIGFPNPLRCNKLRRPPFPVALSLKRRIEKPTVSLSSIPSFLLFSFLF